MKYRTGELPRVYLNQGDVCFTSEPSLLVTVLGSCVSVTFYYREQKIAAMCHGFLPCGNCRRNDDTIFRYMNCSLDYIIQRFEQLRIPKQTIETKVFGGACMVNGDEASPYMTVGYKNIQKTLEILKRENFKIAAIDTGGQYGRKIVFNTATGDVRLRRLKTKNLPKRKSKKKNV